jgi:glycosyltransferase involved in cell wall biosynthesis
MMNKNAGELLPYVARDESLGDPVPGCVTSMRPVLFIAYNFPPAGGIGVQRSLKFVKYLPQFGWQPVVITTTPAAYAVCDASLWADVPIGTPVHRVRSYDVNGLRPLCARLKLDKLLTALNVALMLPDPALLWSRLARSTVRRVIERHQPGLIYSSSGPLSAHLLGMWVKRTFGLPWVADFRDRWWTEEWPSIPRLPGYRAINHRMQRQVLATADRSITVSQPMADAFHGLAGRKKPSVSVIENGYDEDEIVPLPPQRTDRFTMTYTGTLNKKYPVDAFVAAIEQLIADGKMPLEQSRVLFAGSGFDRYVPDRPPFEKLGFLDRDALVDLRRQSDLFILLLHASVKNLGLYTGKVFEYLGSNRPTLFVGHPDNVAAQLLKRARAGDVACHNPSEIAVAVLRYYHAWQSGNVDYAPDWSVIRQYTRRNLTAQLAAEFRHIVTSKRS